MLGADALDGQEGHGFERYKIDIVVKKEGNEKEIGVWIFLLTKTNNMND